MSTTERLLELAAYLKKLADEAPAALVADSSGAERLRMLMTSVSEHPLSPFCGMPVYVDPTLPSDTIRILTGAEHRVKLKASRWSVE